MSNIRTKIKAIITITDSLGEKMSLLSFSDQKGKVIRVSNSEGESAIYMNDESLQKLQRCLNKMFPSKFKQTMAKKIERANRVETVCQENINQFDKILQSVCLQMELMPEAVSSGRKFRELSKARMVICYLARKHTSMSYPDLADMFGEKTHASSLVRVWKYKERCDTKKHNGQTLGIIAGRVEEDLGLK